MKAPTLVVVSFYDKRASADLSRLMASLDRFDAGALYDLAIVANRTSEGSLDLPLPPSVIVLERPNTGMNIGAWDHGWRALPGYQSYLFMQDECFAVRDGWLDAYLKRIGEPDIGLLGESLNTAWDKSWAALKEQRAGEALPDHLIDGRPAERVDAYLDFMRRNGVEPGAGGRHLRSLIWFARRDTLKAIDGFPIGANYGECIAAEIAVSRKIEAAGLRIEQVAPEEFSYFHHAEFERNAPNAPYTHARSRQQAQDSRVNWDDARDAVIFRVHDPSPLMASTRYRVLMPALGLEQLGYPCIVTDGPIPDSALAACRCVVFAKAFRSADVALARDARRHGAPVILDLCDNMFIPEYNDGRGGAYAENFRTMAAIAACIVTTGPALRDVIHDVAPGTPVTIIPDQVETPELLAAVMKRGIARVVTWRDRAAFALRNPGAALRRAGARLSASRERVPAPASSGTSEPRRMIIWFGNRGAGHSAFGMGALAPVIPHLVALASEHPIKLLIVSNSFEKFTQLFANAPFPTEYREWSAERIFPDLDEAEICLIPIPREPFALAKSANRVALALSRDVAVVADRFPALADFADCVIADDWAGGLRAYLEDEDRRARDVACGKEIIAASYSAEAVARRWSDLLESLPKRTA